MLDPLKSRHDDDLQRSPKPFVALFHAILRESLARHRACEMPMVKAAMEWAENHYGPFHPDVLRIIRNHGMTTNYVVAQHIPAHNVFIAKHSSNATAETLRHGALEGGSTNGHPAGRL